MIQLKDLKSIGTIQRTHGLKGELNAVILIDPDFLTEGYPIIMEEEGIFVPFYAESVRPKGATTDLVKLEDVDTEEAAKPFVNKEIYALTKDLEEFLGDDDDEFLGLEDIEGYSVTDIEAGYIGKVSRVDDSTENVLLTVTPDTGGEIFIPLVDAFIREINRDKKSITVDVPEELINLNSGKDSEN